MLLYIVLYSTFSNNAIPMNDFGCAVEYFNEFRDNLVWNNIKILLSLSSAQYLRISTKIKYICSQASLSVVEFFFTLIFHNLNFLIYRSTISATRVSASYYNIYTFIYIMCPRMVTAAASKNFSALSIFKRTVKIITTTMIYKYERKFMYSLARQISFIINNFYFKDFFGYK